MSISEKSYVLAMQQALLALLALGAPSRSLQLSWVRRGKPPRCLLTFTGDVLARGEELEDAELATRLRLASNRIARRRLQSTSRRHWGLFR